MFSGSIMPAENLFVHNFNFIKLSIKAIGFHIHTSYTVGRASTLLPLSLTPYSIHIWMDHVFKVYH